MNTNKDIEINVLGKTPYIDDLPELPGMLHAAVVPSPSAHGKLLTLHTEKALALDKSVIILTSKDIKGMNELGHAVHDEPLIIEKEWMYKGQTVALVLASSRRLARKAASLVKVEGEELEVITDEREAFKKGLLILKPRTMKSGDTEKAFSESDYVITGNVTSGSQEHVYLETQGAVAHPSEGSKMNVISSTQAPSGTQETIARILGVSMNLVEVETKRLGGGFGGKEDQAAQWACLAALGAQATGKSVKIYLNRRDDMILTGKRHPYSSDYKIGINKDGTITAFEADYYQNSGACTDLSPAILSRTLFHGASAYKINNMRVTGYMCRTNLPPFTAFRGFGAPQGIFVIECAIHKASEVLGMKVIDIQKKNLIKSGDIFHYGMEATDVRTDLSFNKLLTKIDIEKKDKEILNFNQKSPYIKKGYACLPLCFGISFTKLMMNQAGALVHIYNDGSVLVNTGAVEMGQGVNRKIAIVASKTLGIPLDLIRLESTRTITVANTMPTAASTGSDLNGMAAEIACTELKERLTKQAAALLESSEEDIRFSNGVISSKSKSIEWKALITKTYENRIDLSAHGFYATPNLVYDMVSEYGNPFCYHVYGAGFVEVSVDTLRGTYTIDMAHLIHDAGETIDENIDIGQVEGAFAQGLGYSVLEEIVYDKKGILLSDTLSTYKLPDADFMPKMEIEFLKDVPNKHAVLASKGIGEPPFIYGLAAYFAILNALKAKEPTHETFYSLPMTNEKVLLFLEGVKQC